MWNPSEYELQPYELNVSKSQTEVSMDEKVDISAGQAHRKAGRHKRSSILCQVRDTFDSANHTTRPCHADH